MATRSSLNARCGNPRVACAAAVVLLLSGCTHIALRDNTVKTVGTLTDLHFQQVLDNVARFHDDPNSLPSFAIASSGSVSVSDTVGAGLTPTYSPTLNPAQQGGGALPILSLMSPLSTQRALTENWTLTPLTDPDALRRLRHEYQRLVAGNDTPSAARRHEQGNALSLADAEKGTGALPQRGWYTFGSSSDVPQNARYVGHHEDTYVWVTAEGTDGLASFALAVLDIAGGKPRTAQRTVVRKYHGDLIPENLVETLVTSIEDAPDAAVAAPEAPNPMQGVIPPSQP